MYICWILYCICFRRWNVYFQLYQEKIHKTITRIAITDRHDGEELVGPQRVARLGDHPLDGASRRRGDLVFHLHRLDHRHELALPNRLADADLDRHDRPLQWRDDGSKPGVGTITTIIPVGLAVSVLKKGVTGEYTGIGSASMEAEILDSVSNERIGAAIDKDPGGKMDVGKLSPAKAAFKFWAKRLRAFLDDVHGVE